MAGTVKTDAPMTPGGKKRWWQSLGPGIVTGAADDDPSGIATYSIAGAQFGTTLLWTAWLTWPLMMAVQLTCARIGMVTGRGLMANLKKRFGRRVLLVVAVALFLTNTLNVGADLAGMADAARLVTCGDARVFTIAFALGIGWATIRFRYATITRVLKWLTLSLFVYIVAAFAASPNWGEVARAFIVPALPSSRGGWGMLVAILGTTISPYLFFWQASQEVEEEKAMGRSKVADRRGATPGELKERKIDVVLGTLVSNIAMFFIILTTALTLHARQAGVPDSTAEVARALQPLLGRFAALLYTLGIVGTGLLAIPTLAGSAAYAFAEIFGWRQGMDEKLHRAKAFYGVLAVSLALGVTLQSFGVNPVRALYLSAMVNGLLAPLLLAGILIVAADRKLMAGQPSPGLARAVVACATVVMLVAAVAMAVL
jgi:Mn2+/Fe2+ NRAMP family transporter